MRGSVSPFLTCIFLNAPVVLSLYKELGNEVVWHWRPNAFATLWFTLPPRNYQETLYQTVPLFMSVPNDPPFNTTADWSDWSRFLIKVQGRRMLAHGPEGVVSNLNSVGADVRRRFTMKTVNMGFWEGLWRKLHLLGDSYPTVCDRRPFWCSAVHLRSGWRHICPRRIDRFFIGDGISRNHLVAYTCLPSVLLVEV